MIVLRNQLYLCIAILLCVFPLPLAADQTDLEVYDRQTWMTLRYHFQMLTRDSRALPIRILHIGDSHTEAPEFSGRLRKLVQQRFGDSGPGFLQPCNLLDTPKSHLGRGQKFSNWVCMREQKQNTISGATLGGFAAYSQIPYQFLGYRLLSSNKSAKLILYTDPEVTSRPRFKVFYERVEIAPITRVPNGRSFYELPAIGGHLEILSRSGGAMPRLRALNLLYEIPGVSYSTIGIKGASFNILQEWRGETVRLQMSDCRPDLLMLEFGTNDVVAHEFSREAFIKTLRKTEEWIGEYANHAAVLMILPPDLPRHEMRVQENLSILREQIRISAKKNGWIVWDWSHAIENASGSHVGLDKFYAQDGVHLTQAGYLQSANQLFEALWGGL